MTSPLRKERDIEKEEGSEMDRAQPLNPTRPLDTFTTSPEAEARPDKPRLVQSEQAVSERMEAASKGTIDKGNPVTEEASLFPRGELGELQGRWDQIQTSFVDQPRTAVHDAELLVSQAMQRMSDVFADERSKLERQWNTGSNVSTEDLRVVFQRYRSFFRRVLSVWGRARNDLKGLAIKASPITRPPPRNEE
jgi:hypothetical protein